jgi:hypothetical protein
MSKNSDLNVNTPPDKSGAPPGEDDDPVANDDRDSVGSATGHVDTGTPGPATAPSLPDAQSPAPDTSPMVAQRATSSLSPSPQPTGSDFRPSSTSPTGNERATVATHVASPTVAGTVPLDNEDTPVVPPPLAVPFDPLAYPPPAAVHGKRTMKSKQAHQFENQKSQKTAAHESAPPLQLKSAPNPYQVSIFML